MRNVSEQKAYLSTRQRDDSFHEEERMVFVSGRAKERERERARASEHETRLDTSRESIGRKGKAHGSEIRYSIKSPRRLFVEETEEKEEEICEVGTTTIVQSRAEQQSSVALHVALVVTMMASVLLCRCRYYCCCCRCRCCRCCVRPHQRKAQGYRVALASCHILPVCSHFIVFTLFTCYSVSNTNRR